MELTETRLATISFFSSSAMERAQLANGVHLEVSPASTRGNGGCGDRTEPEMDIKPTELLLTIAQRLLRPVPTNYNIRKSRSTSVLVKGPRLHPMDLLLPLASPPPALLRRLRARPTIGRCWRAGLRVREVPDSILSRFTEQFTSPIRIQTCISRPTSPTRPHSLLPLPHNLQPFPSVALDPIRLPTRSSSTFRTIHRRCTTRFGRRPSLAPVRIRSLRARQAVTLGPMLSPCTIPAERLPGVQTCLASRG